MKILIRGGGFSNKGAEAMLATTQAFFQKRFPGCSVLHCAQSKAIGDRMRELGVTPITPPGYISRNIRWPECAKALAPVPFRPREDLLNDENRDIDAVVDIAGFASGDQWGLKSATARWWSVRRHKTLRAPIIFMPQSWGPFKHFLSRLFTKAMLRDIPLAFARDHESYDHLQKLRVLCSEALQLAPDITFTFKPSPPEKGKAVLERAGVAFDGRPVVGLAPNLRVYERTQGDGADNRYVRLLADTCRFFAEECDATVVVIPHERCPEPEIADDRFLSQILSETLYLGDRLCCVDEDCASADLKAAIGTLDFLVGSRFHAILAGLCMRIPLVSLGWSHKYGELMSDVGLAGYVMTLDEIERCVTDLIKKAWDERDRLKAVLENNLPALETASAKALELTAQYIERSLV